MKIIFGESSLSDMVFCALHFHRRENRNMLIVR